MSQPKAPRAAALRAARAHVQAGRPRQAEPLYRSLLTANSSDAEALHGWGMLRQAIGDTEGAATLLNAAVAAGAGPGAVADLAALHLAHNRIDAAETLLLDRGGESAPAQTLLGQVAEARGDLALAADRYRTALRRDPAQLDARRRLASVLAAAGRLEEAVAAYAALISRAPRDAAALQELAWLYGRLNRFHDALDCLQQAERAGADVAWVLSHVALGLAHACDWKRREALRRQIRARLARPGPCLINPYAVLGSEDDPRVLARVGEATAEAVRAKVGDHPRPIPRRSKPGERIRIGYLSGDFHSHATAHLMTEVFELHDRARFDVAAYDHSPDDGTPMRTRVCAAFERFVPLGQEPPAVSARRIAADRLDLLVDLKGYTQNARPELMAFRPAPVQVSYLGYPGPLGAPWIDYVIADPVVLPFAEQPHWRERIVQLPHCYQPNDRARPLPPPDADRAAHGLPEDAFVFTCFNNSYKITPEVFAAWIELLAAVPGSVLWLLEDNPLMAASLRAEAASRGTDPARLVFAPVVQREAHLARHGCADLFVDTFPYGAHTTGSDALWAGLPLVTLAGRGFASRVAASLLQAVGLPELIVTSLPDYVALARALAADPARLAALRVRLQSARSSAPLFDAPALTRALESAFATMVDIARSGGPPSGFAVAPQAESQTLQAMGI